MYEIDKFLPLMIPLTALLAVPLIYFFRNQRDIRDGVSVLAPGTMFALAFLVFKNFYQNKEPLFIHILDITPTVSLQFRVDGASILFSLIASFLWIITTIYSRGYLGGLREKKQTSFYAYFALTLFATQSLAYSGNLITTFIFYELITLFTYPLVTHKGSDEAIKAGRKYFAYLIGTSLIFFLTAIVLTLSLKGEMSYKETGIFDGSESVEMLLLIFLFFLFGVAKAAIMPVHAWLPAAMVAPTPVSALLHAVAVVKAGVFVLYRVFNFVFTPDIIAGFNGHFIALTFSAITIVVASMIALRQDNLKRRLAYSTISQLSYIIFGFSLLNSHALTGSLYHLIMHAFGKITLFFCAGSIYVTTHISEISKLDGIGKKLPITMFCFAIGSLSMIGMPLFGGFVSKYYLLKGIAYSDYQLLFAIFGISTLLNAAYFLPIVYASFFKPPKEEIHLEAKESQRSMEFALSITALGTIVLFFVHGFFYPLIGV